MHIQYVKETCAVFCDFQQKYYVRLLFYDYEQEVCKLTHQRR